ncbi:MAG: ArsC family transcriptional regulator [Eggerthellales bacterium]|nr:ArsC family transcriptional regulator [Eggerthellales bacterium]
MNIQIFGVKKSFDTKKAERYFKERRVKYQFIDLKEKEMSKGEFSSVVRAVGGIDATVDASAKDEDLLAMLPYLGEEARYQKVFENQHLLRMPVVRNGAKATVGYAPEVWKTWE